MDGRGCSIDNIFIKCLWRLLQYECVYLHAFGGGSDARQGIEAWISFLQPTTTTHRPWRYHPGFGISNCAAGLRCGVPPVPPADTHGSVMRVIENLIGRPPTCTLNRPQNCPTNAKWLTRTPIDKANSNN